MPPTMASARLRRVARLLSDGKPHSTRDIMRRARVCAISSCVAELRVRGADIVCERHTINGKGIFFYTMTPPAQEITPDLTQEQSEPK